MVIAVTTAGSYPCYASELSLFDCEPILFPKCNMVSFLTRKIQGG